MTSETSSAEETTTSPSPFRTASEPVEVAPLPSTDRNQPIGSTETADGLFIGYETDNGVPYVVDYLGLRDTFKADPETYSEVSDITIYLENLVRTGEIDNSIEAIKAKLKSLEKLSGVEDSERVNMKLTRLAEYAKFENKINDAKRSSIKWSR
jgi:hypothetical protein